MSVDGQATAAHGGLHCPVCRARFRGEVICPRCGADLSAVMTLAARAYRGRQAARAALTAGEIRRAQALAVDAQALCDTRAGRRLLLLSTALVRGFDALLEENQHSMD